MDDVIKGTIGGVVGSLLILLVGVLSFNGNTVEFMTSGRVLYMWLLLLSGITIGQFVFTYIIVDAWTANPKQTDAKVV